MPVVARISIESSAVVVWDSSVERAVRIKSGSLDVFNHHGELIRTLSRDGVSRWRPDGFAYVAETLVAREDDALVLTDSRTGSTARIAAPARRPHFHSTIAMEDPDLVAFMSSDTRSFLNVARISTREVLFRSEAVGVPLELHWLKLVDADHIAINSIAEGARTEVWNWRRRECVHRDETIEGVEKSLELGCVDDGATLRVREHDHVRATWRWGAIFPPEAHMPRGESRFTAVRPTWAGAKLVALLVGAECVLLDVGTGAIAARVSLSEREGRVQLWPSVPLASPISPEDGVITAFNSTRLACRMRNCVEICFSTAELMGRLQAN